MTGRDGGAEIAPIGNSPVVVLVRPQLADNIGAVARAMANGGLFHLRMVDPRDGWPQEKAWRNASGADRILEAATLHASVAEAVADLHRVFATGGRPRHIVKPVLNPARRRRRVARHLRARPAGRHPVRPGTRRAGQRRHSSGRRAGALPPEPGLPLAQPGPGRHGAGLRMVDGCRRHPAAPPDDQRNPRGHQGANWRISSATSSPNWTPAASCTTCRNAPAWYATFATSSNAAKSPNRNCAPCTAW